jgi:hypothetical protein
MAPYHQGMSVSMYEGQIRQHERTLQRHRKSLSDALKDVAKLERDIAGLNKQANTTKSDTSRRSYLSRAESKQRELSRARDKHAKAAKDIASEEGKLAEARRKLADAQAKAERKTADKSKREQEQRDRREKADRQRREQEALFAEGAQALREAERDRELSILSHRTTELERQLADAERRAAPKEVTVLFLASSPEDQQALRLDKETREIQKQVRAAEYRDSIWFEWRLARRVTDLIQDLNEVTPHIIHFSGHGSRAELAFEDADGATHPLTNDQLGRLLQAGQERIRLAVFNSCDSAAQAALACNHIDVAIGMESSVGDEAAKTFAAQFYNSLGFGLSVGQAFRQAVLQVELVHGEDHEVPQLFSKDQIDPETVVLVNPDDV